MTKHSDGKVNKLENEILTIFGDDYERLAEINTLVKIGIDQVNSNEECKKLIDLSAKLSDDYKSSDKTILEIKKLLDLSSNSILTLQTDFQNVKESLDKIGSDINSMQNDSAKIKIAILKSEKEKARFKNFIESLMLDSELIKTICAEKIDENFFLQLDRLDRKLDNITETNLYKSESVKTLISILNSLKNEASNRAYSFLLAKIESLEGSSVNVQIYQEILVKCNRVFYFLLKNSATKANALKDKYVSIIKKKYNLNFEKYIASLETTKYKNIKTLFVLNSENKFDIGKRITILNKESVVLDLPQSKGCSTLLFEEGFFYLNNLLMSVASSEFNFVSIFFKDPSMFNLIFDCLRSIILEYLVKSAKSIKDLYAILICIRINQKNQEIMSTRKIDCLDFYFHSLNITLWPLAKSLFLNLIDSVDNIETKSQKNCMLQITNIVHGITVCNTQNDQILNTLLEDFIEKFDRKFCINSEPDNKDPVSSSSFSEPSSKTVVPLSTTNSFVEKRLRDLYSKYADEKLKKLSLFLLRDSLVALSHFGKKTDEKTKMVSQIKTLVNSQLVKASWKTELAELLSEVAQDFNGMAYKEIKSRLIIRFVDLFEECYAKISSAENKKCFGDYSEKINTAEEVRKIIENCDKLQ